MKTSTTRNAAALPTAPVASRAFVLALGLLAATALAHPTRAMAETSEREQSARTDAAEAGAKADNVLGQVTEAARNLRLSKVPGTIEVRSDRLEFDYRKGSLAYAGNVVVEHSGTTIRADRVSLAFTPGRKPELKNITAEGHVRVDRGKETASGEKAVYDPEAATVVLSENARLGSGPNTLTGERVVVYLAEERAVVESAPGAVEPPPPPPGQLAEPGAPVPSGRVRVVIQPDSVDEIGSDLKGILPDEATRKRGASGEDSP